MRLNAICWAQGHLCVPVKHWYFWRRWMCIKCQRIFRDDVR